MNRKIFTLIVAASLISLTASSQASKDNMDKLPKEKRDEMNAKADVLIQKRSRTIADPSVSNSPDAKAPATIVSDPQEKVKSNKKKHRKHWKKKKKSVYK